MNASLSLYSDSNEIAISDNQIRDLQINDFSACIKYLQICEIRIGDNGVGLIETDDSSVGSWECEIGC
jgi:hypothetical protein